MMVVVAVMDEGTYIVGLWEKRTDGFTDTAQETLNVVSNVRGERTEQGIDGTRPWLHKMDGVEMVIAVWRLARSVTINQMRCRVKIGVRDERVAVRYPLIVFVILGEYLWNP